MAVHNLKIWPKYFTDILLGLKKVEIRKNDRDFKERDVLILAEWDTLLHKFTGLTATMTVTYVIKDVPGLEPDYVILQLSKPI